jgi:serine/threonine-protein kinase
MGEVYRAYDHRLERWVAIKVIRTDSDDEPSSRLSDDASARERFRREARAVAGLSHPGIVQIHDIVEWEGRDCIVMELVEGETLSHVLRRGRLPLPRALTIARQVAEGLAAAHAKGVIHRDLKAENVMITAEGQAKILDFGLAKRLGPAVHEMTLSIQGKVLGTSYAMSPEQAQGHPVDHRSDVFSFGTLLYEMVTGNPPFRRENLAETLTWVCTKDPPPAHEVDPNVPATLSELVHHLLAKEPERRPESAGRVAEVLRYLERDLTGAEGGTASFEPATGSIERPDEPTVPTMLGLPGPAYRPSAEPSSPGASGTWTGARAGPVGPSVPYGGATPSIEGGTRPWTRRTFGGALIVGLLGVIALVVAGVVWVTESRADEIYVAVTAPSVSLSGDAGSVELIPSAVRVALLQELLSLEGITALAPDQVDAAEGTSVELARTLAADEVITARLTCGGTSCQANLSRIRGSDGGLLWTQIFEVRRDDLLTLSNTVGDRLRQAYGDRRLRDTGEPLDVASPDYEQYLRIREAFRTRLEESDLGDLLERIAAVRRSSPRFVPAYLLEARIALDRFRQESRDERDLTRAFDAIEQARILSPRDPQPLFTLFDVAIVAGRLDVAQEAVETLERLEPNDAEVQAKRAMLVEREGRLERALELMREAVSRRPSEDNLLRLAQMEMHRGQMESARETLGELLDRAPDSHYGRGMLAQLELVSGQPERAVELYEQSAERSPGPVAWTNLGVAYMLQGRYDEAVEVFLLALEKQPSAPFAVLNLADAELLAGRPEQADALYRRVLDLTASDPARSNWQILTMRAQALAHLDRETDAVVLVQRALQTAPEHPQAAFEAAVVYALVGEDRSALVNSRRALELGYEPVWFRFPWFDDLRDDPEFKRLLGSAEPG